MKVTDFINDFKKKKIMNSKANEHAVEDYIRKTLEVKTFLPFNTKREIVSQIVDANINVVDGYMTISSINQFISFIIAMLVAYTNLEVDDPYEAYDLLTESNLMQNIIECFRSEYDACDILLKMEVEDRMQTNTTPAIIAQFLNKISESVGALSDVAKDKISEINLSDIIDSNIINKENIANLISVLDKEK